MLGLFERKKHVWVESVENQHKTIHVWVESGENQRKTKHAWRSVRCSLGS
jgi:hypothetical protein